MADPDGGRRRTHRHGAAGQRDARSRWRAYPLWSADARPLASCDLAHRPTALSRRWVYGCSAGPAIRSPAKGAVPRDQPVPVRRGEGLRGPGDLLLSEKRRPDPRKRLRQGCRRVVVPQEAWCWISGDVIDGEHLERDVPEGEGGEVPVDPAAVRCRQRCARRRVPDGDRLLAVPAAQPHPGPRRRLAPGPQPGQLRLAGLVPLDRPAGRVHPYAQRGPGQNPGNAVHPEEHRRGVLPRATRAGADPGNTLQNNASPHPLINAQRGPGPNLGNTPARRRGPAAAPRPRNEGRDRTRQRRKSSASGCAQASITQRGTGPNPGNARTLGGDINTIWIRAQRGPRPIPATPSFQPGTT